ncbi:DUF3426 domain-containing protein [Pseudomonas sp. R5(2019)]|uniref:DUF3426 domain-containing protein n=1 Tax=Pseudomonas sp. R5(2019) TaxID=2697566 RepID=UPI0014133F56|nr:DUF3426 domain-containing protein [Pseudomonas sp. R5(2019)]NBA95103.1 DUF3426 domain-containing protein [Pseudomonas sp. R5(2019)]
MTDSFVTQCPHCQTSFRVSHTQLSVARGVVRCGACLQVFNAARQLLEQSSAREARQALTPSAQPIPAPAPEAPATGEPKAPVSQREWSPAELDLDNLDLDKLDLDRELARLEQREIEPTTEFGHIRPPRAESLSAQRDVHNVDEPPLAGGLFGSADDGHPHGEPELQPPTIEPIAFDKPEPARFERTEPSLSLDADEDLDVEPRRPLPVVEKPVERPPARERLTALDPLDEQDDEPLRRDPPLETRRDKGVRHEPGLNNDGLADLVDDPLQLDWQKRRTPWGKRLLWFILVLLAAAALAGQYIWYHFDELARQDQYRPWFQQLCPQLGCKVPSKVDISLIKSSNLVVRSHPDFKGALIVDAIIYNRATFSQPFPLLELRFADLNGQLIASRRFKPGEYLSGELAGKAEMPPQTPIHIALDILDPGSRAVNYSLSFRSPE